MECQKIYDTVRKHLLTQNARSVIYRDDPSAAALVLPEAWESAVRDDEGREFICVYRSPEGRKCAAGVLIPDNLYNPAFEGRKVYCDDIRSSLRLDGERISNAGMTLIRDLQVVHDRYEPATWSQHLDWIAGTYNLKAAGASIAEGNDNGVGS